MLSSVFLVLAASVALVGASVLGWQFFERIAWCWPGVSLLVGRPDLRGTWKGTLKSDFWTRANQQLGNVGLRPGGHSAQPGLGRATIEQGGGPVFEQLIERFSEAPKARHLATEAGFPRSRLPEFQNALLFWSEIRDEVEGGAPPGNMVAFFEAAAALYPGNDAFSFCRSLLPQSMIVVAQGVVSLDGTSGDKKELPSSKEVFLVIRQTLTSLSLRLLTDESSSATITASIVREPDGRYSIAAIYESRPKQEHQYRSRIHRGGLCLELAGQAGAQLAGEYWTDRGTTGCLDLRRVDRRRVSGWNEARELLGPESADVARRDVSLKVEVAAASSRGWPKTASS